MLRLKLSKLKLEGTSIDFTQHWDLTWHWKSRRRKVFRKCSTFIRRVRIRLNLESKDWSRRRESAARKCSLSYIDSKIRNLSSRFNTKICIRSLKSQIKGKRKWTSSGTVLTNHMRVLVTKKLFLPNITQHSIKDHFFAMSSLMKISSLVLTCHLALVQKLIHKSFHRLTLVGTLSVRLKAVISIVSEKYTRVKFAKRMSWKQEGSQDCLLSSWKVRGQNQWFRRERHSTCNTWERRMISTRKMRSDIRNTV